MIEQEHDCKNPDPDYLFVPRIGPGTQGQGRVWLELCPDCGPHVGDQEVSNDGKLCRVEYVQPGGPWPNWTPGVGVYIETAAFTHTFIGRWFTIKKRREELVAEKLLA